MNRGDRASRVWCARSPRSTAGQVVNPDGLINQIEGAIVQSMSWTLYESVTFDDTRITSVDWQTYPILRFDCGARQHRGAYHQPARPAVPRQRRNRTGSDRGIDRQRHRRCQPAKRLRDLPLTRKRIKAIDA